KPKVGYKRNAGQTQPATNSMLVASQCCVWCWLLTEPARQKSLLQREVAGIGCGRDGEPLSKQFNHGLIIGFLNLSEILFQRFDLILHSQRLVSVRCRSAGENFCADAEGAEFLLGLGLMLCGQ